MITAAVWRWLDRTWLGQRLQNIQVAVTAARVTALEDRKLIRELKEQIMDNLDTLQAAVDRNGAAVASAVTGIVDLRGKVAALQEEVNTGTLDQTRLAGIVASIDASTDAVAQALAPVVEDPDVPTGEAEVPPAENPDTAPPVDVEGSVPAGEPLPDSV